MAVAVELIHTYSLVHDDLPCMDDDAIRRGRPAVHIAHGEAIAVLAGDALQTLAFEALAGAAREVDGSDPDEPLRVLAATRELTDAAGGRNLVGGQTDDLAFDPENRDAEAVESIHRRKSAALIAAAVAGGATLAGAESAVVDELRQFGLDVGVAFQITDDVLDAGEEDACSLVRALGLEQARERAEELLIDALGRLESLGERAEPLRDLARLAVRRET
jgi:geranylgeranyl diphosphate synthase type II